ncbi:MAG: AAA family ATPase [Deltaproteobacteria bacterium]|nr:AAA family ATPase [Deltaproteobacteria bacterium]
MPQPPPAKLIVVAGDVAVDWFGFAVPPLPSPKAGAADARQNWQRKEGTRFVVRPGGAFLQARLLEAATGCRTLGPALDEAAMPGLDSGYLRSHADLALVAASKADAKRKLYRVARWGGFASPAKEAHRIPAVAQDDAAATIVVLDDAGNGFRDRREAWPLAIRDAKATPQIVLKMHAPLFQGDLWELLLKRHSERLTVVLLPDDLRAAGVNLGRGLSWERTALDFVWQMSAHPMLPSLSRCAQVVVMFRLDGAIVYQPGAKHPTTLYYDPANIEGGYADGFAGGMVGTTSAFVAGIVGALAKDDGRSLADGIAAGLWAGRRLLRQGFGEDPATFNPANAGLFDERTKGEAKFESVAVPTDAKTLEDPESWSILRDKSECGFEETAYALVREGADGALRGIPVGVFGAFRTVDRMEIEGFRAVKNLLGEYIADPRPPRPLSVAVFGPPGAGKSFGVNEVATSVGGKDVQKIEFNVSQFSAPEDLVRALHKVRDVVLLGKLPLVFFDEFDSSFGGEPLGWLKYFLAPMQDGRFKDGETDHPIGKAIFVFAGGTSHRFRDFARAEASPEEAQAFARRKGPDFVSRLRGFIDIADLNPSDDGDDVYLLRRALVLRSMLERKDRCQSIREGATAHVATVHVDPGVLRALVKSPVYKHRARSLEAIIDMSMLGRRPSFEQASLPPHDQLDLHVDAESFLRLVARDALLGSMREKLGRAVHERFLEEQKGKRPAEAREMQPWESLDEDLKESNRQQADDIPNKLRAIGCGFEPAPEGQTPEPFDFTAEDINEMARLEHKRWNEEKLRDGWRYGEKKDKEAKTTPYLVDFDKLSPEVQQYDVDAVKGIPDLLRRAGFRIYRIRRE